MARDEGGRPSAPAKRPGKATMRSRALALAPAAGATAFLALVALAWCAPAISHGTVFGSFDLALRAGIGKSLVESVHNVVSGDQARQDAVWAHLNWEAVHHGRLPLWNPYSDLGLPELANFQSAPASLPSLVSYAFPVSLAYSVTVVVKLFVGGTGCYCLARVLGVSRPIALLAGVVGELAGPSAAWSGWPQTGVSEWTGWVLALVVLCSRAPSWCRVVALGVVVAFAFAGGFPEVLALLAGTALVVAIGSLAGRPRRARPSRRGRLHGLERLEALGALCAAAGLGAALSAPVWLPAIRVLAASVSAERPIEPVLPVAGLALFLDPTWFGLPTATSPWFGPSNYYETAAFVGPAVLCAAAIGIRRLWRRAEVLALVVAAAGLLLLAFGAPLVSSLADSLPGLRSIAFGRGLLVTCDLIGVLGALGLEELTRRGAKLVDWVTLAAFAALTLGMLGIAETTSSLTRAERHVRLEGLWLAALPLVGLAVWLVLSRRRTRAGDRSRVAATWLLVGLEAGALVAGSISISTWSKQYLPRNDAISGLKADVGGGLVALGGDHGPAQAPRLGLFPELNAAYGIRELAGYDAVTPRALLDTWTRLAPAPDLAAHELSGDVTSFAPDVTTAAQARALGVSYLLEPIHGTLRLVDGAGDQLGADLARAGIHSSSVTTGLLDDLEWRLDEPLVARAYPASSPGSLGRYLGTLAGPAGAGIAPPAPLGQPAAIVATRAMARDPALEPALEALVTRAPPTGFVKIATLGPETLYELAGPAGAVFPPGTGRALTSLAYVTDARATITLDATHATWVQLSIDGEPGWSASTAGRALPTRDARGIAGALLEVRVPPGRHVVALSYWPAALGLSLWLTALGVLVALVGIGIAWIAQRKHKTEDEYEDEGEVHARGRRAGATGATSAS